MSIKECGRPNNGPPGMSMTYLQNLRNFAYVIRLGILRLPCRMLVFLVGPVESQGAFERFAGGSDSEKN